MSFSKDDFITKDSGERVKFDSGMVRDTENNKIDYSLVLGGPMFHRWAALLHRGAVKYTRNNWMKARGNQEEERFIRSAFRHFIQWMNGDKDEDHAAAVFFNVNGAEYVRGQQQREATEKLKDVQALAYREPHDTYAHRRAELNALILRHQKERKDFEQWQNEKTNGNLGGARA